MDGHIDIIYGVCALTEGDFPSLSSYGSVCLSLCDRFVFDPVCLPNEMNSTHQLIILPPIDHITPQHINHTLVHPASPQ